MVDDARMDFGVLPTFEADFGGGSGFNMDGGTPTKMVTNHGALQGRNLADQHPIEAISDLEDRLSGIMESVEDVAVEPLSNMELEKLLK
jgi:hypothetical protein